MQSITTFNIPVDDDRFEEDDDKKIENRSKSSGDKLDSTQSCCVSGCV